MKEDEQLREWERMEEEEEYQEACRVANKNLWLCDDGEPMTPHPHSKCHSCEMFFKCEKLPPCASDLGKLYKQIAIREAELNRKAGLEDNLTTACGYYTAAGVLNWVRKMIDELNLNLAEIALDEKKKYGGDSPEYLAAHKKVLENLERLRKDSKHGSKQGEQR